MSSIRSDLDRFYRILARLSAAPHQGRPLGEYDGRAPWPKRGVYFFREPGEQRSRDASVSRIVRVGTHAVSAGSKSTLWRRLRAHRGGKSGGGNHRGSIFRLHVGAAMLERDGRTIATWGKRPVAPRPTPLGEAEHERRVSCYIREMPVVWVSADDEPGPNSVRACIERNCIALLSSRLHPVDRPSGGWLGSSSQRDEIKRSGLWNLQYLEKTYDPAFLDKLEELVTHTIRASQF